MIRIDFSFPSVCDWFYENGLFYSKELGCACGTTWKLHVYPKGKSPESPRNLCVGINRIGTSDEIYLKGVFYMLFSANGVTKCVDTESFTYFVEAGKKEASVRFSKISSDVDYRNSHLDIHGILYISEHPIYDGVKDWVDGLKSVKPFLYKPRFDNLHNPGCFSQLYEQQNPFLVLNDVLRCHEVSIKSVSTTDENKLKMQMEQDFNMSSKVEIKNVPDFTFTKNSENRWGTGAGSTPSQSIRQRSAYQNSSTRHHSPSTSTPNHQRAEQDASLMDKLSRDYFEMFEISRFHDLTVTCGKQTFHLHKNILSARCPTLATKLQDVENELVIEDVSYFTLSALIVFLYSGRVTDTSVSEACDILKASRNYQLPTLARICTTRLEHDLSLENVLEVLVAANSSSEANLKNLAIKMLIENYNSVVSTDQWEMFKKSQQDLVIQILTSKIQDMQNPSFQNFTRRETLDESRQRILVFNKLSNEYLTMLEVGTFSDAVLICGQQSFPVHRNVLSVRCPVLYQKLKDAVDQGAIVDDIKPDALKAMLVFVYGGKVENLTPALACRLLVASSTYELPDLTKKCATFLKSALTLDNVFKVLVAADKCGNDGLKEFAFNFVVMHFAAVETTQQWEMFLQFEKEMAIKILVLKLRSK